MNTPTSLRLDSSATETVAAIEALRRHESMRIGTSCALVDTAQRRLEAWEADRQDSLLLREARAAAATAATEAAQAARFDARLLGCRGQELTAARDKLEPCIARLHAEQAKAAACLDVAVKDLLGEFAEGLTHGGETGAWAGAERCEMRLAEDLGRALRAHGDRIEQLLLDLGEMIRVTFGLSMGGALPTRVPRDPPQPRLPSAHRDDLSDLPGEVAEAVCGSFERYRVTLDARVEDAIRALRSRLASAGEHQRARPDAVSDRIGWLICEAQELDTLAKRLDWMLPTDCEADRP